jgi:A/G-specific adenine glycosylase
MEPTKKHFMAFIVQRNHRFLVQQRPAKVVNGGLWEFPNVEVSDGKNVQKIHPFEIAPRTNPLCTIKHSITRYRITLVTFRATVRRKQKISAGKWLKIAELEKLAFTSAHRKILNTLAKNGLVLS